MENTNIVDLDQYKKELGEELFDKIMNHDEDDEDSYDTEKMRQECTDYYSKINNHSIQSNVRLIDENTVLRAQH